MSNFEITNEQFNAVFGCDILDQYATDGFDCHCQIYGDDSVDGMIWSYWNERGLPTFYRGYAYDDAVRACDSGEADSVEEYLRGCGERVDPEDVVLVSVDGKNARVRLVKHVRFA